MARDEIKKMVEESKRRLDDYYDESAKSIRDELASSKKRTLDRI